MKNDDKTDKTNDKLKPYHDVFLILPVLKHHQFPSTHMYFSSGESPHFENFHMLRINK
ncbi:hypothetical protein GIB67_041268 [Kingdonia uniflora]|uniref:Uncharacterized protein n=1 Tax=Kingdonia uniflora TaxID=39325 RepID=A0A7J7NIU6_9MAGN|nr:hypothetical protein GIB67_041268 [Kingdonia uniflora]